MGNIKIGGIKVLSMSITKERNKYVLEILLDDKERKLIPMESKHRFSYYVGSSDKLRTQIYLVLYNHNLLSADKITINVWEHGFKYDIALVYESHDRDPLKRWSVVTDDPLRNMYLNIELDKLREAGRQGTIARRVEIYNQLGKIKTYESARECAAEFGCNISKVHYALAGEGRKFEKEYRLRYE